MPTLRGLISRLTGREQRSGPGAAGFGFAAPVLSGVTVTPETALTFSAVYSAVNVIATDVASLPLRVLRELPGGGVAAARKHPAFDLLYCEPNADTTSIRYRTAQMGHVLGWGNSYSRIEWDANGYPAAIHLLSPRACDTRPVRDKGGRLFYETDGGRGPTLPASSVLHVAGLGWDGVQGYSPIAFARQAVGLGMAAEQFGAAFYGNGSTPQGALKKAGKLSKEAAERLRENWERVHQGPSSSNRVAVLEDGLEWQNITVNPVDAQFLETRKFQVVEIARVFNLPPHKIGDYSQAHLANLEESNLDYLNTTLGPWLVAIEQEMNRKLFSRMERARGLHVAHDLTALLRGNMQARATWANTLFQMGSITPDEVRAREGLNPLPHKAGAQTYRPLNMAPLAEADEAKPALPAVALPSPDPEPNPDEADDAAGSDE